MYICIYIYVCMYRLTKDVFPIAAAMSSQNPNMHVCTKFVCVYVHIYIHMCTYVYIYIYTYLCIYVYICTCVYMYLHIHAYANKYVLYLTNEKWPAAADASCKKSPVTRIYLRVSVHICLHVYMYIYIYIHIYIHM